MLRAAVDLTIAVLPVDPAPAGRSAATRELLRQAAGERSGVPAGEIAIVARCDTCGQAHGRPELLHAGRPLGLHASVSRSGPWAIVTVADSPVGVDIEQATRTAFAGFDRVALTAAERAAVAALAPDARAAARAGLWTAKEALLKLSGVGLRIAPCDVPLGTDWDGTVVDDPGQPGRPVALAAVPFADDPDYLVAVASAGDRAPVLRVRRGTVSPAAAAAGSRRATR